MTKLRCIANNGSNGEPEIPLWECPCHECTRLDWEALDSDRPPLAEYRAEMWPEVWGPEPSKARWAAAIEEVREIARG